MIEAVEDFLLSRKERQINNRLVSIGKGYVYKGLGLEGFPAYFEQGGIRPLYPQQATFSDEWSWAAIFPVQLKVSRCIAIIKRDKIEGNFYKSGDTDYQGNYHMPWEAVERFFIDKQTMQEIKSVYDNVLGPKITWNEFAAKVTVIKPTELSFRREFAKFLKGQRR